MSPAAANAVSDFDPGWLAAREPADHDARSAELAGALARVLRPAGAGGAEIVVRDLGCGTGSLARWLAPLLPGPQRWVLHDRDPRLLDVARAGTAGLTAADGSAVPISTVVTDLTALRAADLAGTSVVTASALLDLLTAAEVDALVAACAGAGCPVLWTLSVTGTVRLDPPDPLDAAVAAAFDAHQRRSGPVGRLLGPDAATTTADVLRRHDMVVREADSAWRLGADHHELLTAWLRGRAEAAVEERPDLAAGATRWLSDRLADVDAGRLTAVVAHRDLLGVPDRPPNESGPDEPGLDGRAPGGSRPPEVAT